MVVLHLSQVTFVSPFFCTSPAEVKSGTVEVLEDVQSQW